MLLELRPEKLVLSPEDEEEGRTMTKCATRRRIPKTSTAVPRLQATATNLT